MSRGRPNPEWLICPALEAPATGAYASQQQYLHTVFLIVAGVLTAITILASGVNYYKNGTKWRAATTEQKQKMQIVLCIAASAPIFLASMALELRAWYLQPIGSFLLAYALAVVYVIVANILTADSPDESAPVEQANLPAVTAPENGQKTKRFHWNVSIRTSIPWYPLLCFLWVIITPITMATGKYCITAMDIYFAKLWLNGIKIVSALMTIVSFNLSMRVLLRARKLARAVHFLLVLMQGLVLLEVSQHFGFGFVTSSNQALSFSNMAAGIPNLVLCASLCIASILLPFLLPGDKHDSKTKGELINGEKDPTSVELLPQEGSKGM